MKLVTLLFGSVIFISSCGRWSSLNSSEINGETPRTSLRAFTQWSGDNPFNIKGVHHIFYAMGYTGQVPPDIAGNAVGKVAINVPWFIWEPRDIDTSCGGGELYRGHCYRIETHVSDAINNYARLGIAVTAILFGVPSWATEPDCDVSKNAAAPNSFFCAPAIGRESRFADFAGYVANKFPTQIETFVVHNEVNTQPYFNVGRSATFATRVSRYALSYNAAYDRIRSILPSANVAISLDSSFSQAVFGTSSSYIVSGESFLRSFAGQTGNREWKVAYHPYPVDLSTPVLSTDDLKTGRISMGNIGALEGWLMREYPSQPVHHEIFLTEFGFNRSSSGGPSLQAQSMCRAFQSALGTPHVRSFLYYSFEDNPGEALQFGMVTRQSPGVFTYHPVWSTYALANRVGMSTSCGFENVGSPSTPKMSLLRGYSPSRGHWATSRLLPDAFAREWAVLVDSRPFPGSMPVYECAVAPLNDLARSHSLASLSSSCEGNTPMGVLAYLSPQPTSGSDTALYRCARPGNDAEYI
ncbi:MAG: hypothetical protein HYR96_15490 [Deltaproteobacteria bacterium]|nr:hypothetical protein [Deltaproteobacteria bacterium]